MNRHNLKMTLVITIILYLIFYSESFAESKPSITYGMAKLYLGMSKQEFLSLSNKNNLKYEIIPDFDDPMFSYSVSSNLSPYDHYGQLIFKNNKLVFISKDCSPAKQDSINVVRSLHALLTDIIASHSGKAIIETDTYFQTNYEVKHIYLYTFPYEIHIYAYNKYDKPSENYVSIMKYLKNYMEYKR